MGETFAKEWDMGSFPEAMLEYKQQLQTGTLQVAYRGLMEYMLGLRNHFQNQYPDFFVSGSLYYGYMDMTYFSCFPKSLKDRKLKVAIVFSHQAFRFEIWLAGYNKKIQEKYWSLFQENGWNKYPLVSTTRGADAIMEHVVTADPDFGDLPALTGQIEAATLDFINGVDGFLVTHAR
jgi:hypothetical protein